jgi:hypothetical protein
MQHIVLLFLVLSLSLFAKDMKPPSENIVEVKDTSGLSDAQVRKIAQTKDKKEQKSMRWEDMSPTPTKYDWVQTKSKEWFKGKIKALYNKKLEFDSDEVGLYDFDFEDVIQIKSFYPMSVNIENVAVFSGIIRLKDDKITIIQGDKTFEFNRKKIVSLAPSGNKEFSYWSGKISLGIDIRKGNKEQYDYSAKAKLKRRTSDSNLYLDYLGRISSVDGKESANDHRINEKYDRFITRNFFWTPLSFEYYQDKFQNIKNQITAGIGLGYMVLDTDKVEWDISAGPAFTYIRYISVVDSKERIKSMAFDFSTKIDIKINSKIDFKYDYKATFTDKSAGTYKHHMVSTLENEITSWLDIDLTFVWDYLLDPQQDSNGIIPLKSDYQFLVGLGIEF